MQLNCFQMRSLLGRSRTPSEPFSHWRMQAEQFLEAVILAIETLAADARHNVYFDANKHSRLLSLFLALHAIPSPRNSLQPLGSDFAAAFSTLAVRAFEHALPGQH